MMSVIKIASAKKMALRQERMTKSEKKSAGRLEFTRLEALISGLDIFAEVSGAYSG